jgi:hypothetical protein
MALIEPKGRPFVFCPKCKANVVWPVDISEEQKRTFAQTKRADTLKAAQSAVAQFGFDMREAKCLSFHITREPEKCHRCGGQLRDEVSVCVKCRSANLDW